MMTIHPIAYFHAPFSSKFGIPKQSGLVDSLEGVIEFVPAYRSADALLQIDGFDYLWLIWGFSANRATNDRLMVRPPVLGGNERVGVFASRSPYRPNGLGLSSVRLQSVEWHSPRGPLLHVRGADLMDGTPIYDIKPYLPYADAHPDVRSGFSDVHTLRHLDVVIPDGLLHMFDDEQIATLREVLSLDPRPAYHADEEKVYGFGFMGWDIRFRVSGNQITVVDTSPDPSKGGEKGS